jgi:hypothetical protein
MGDFYHPLIIPFKFKAYNWKDRCTLFNMLYVALRIDPS